MTHNDIEETIVWKNGSHHTIEYATSLCTRLSLQHDTFVVELDVLQTSHIILAKVTCNEVGTTYGDGQAPLIARKVGSQSTVSLG